MMLAAAALSIASPGGKKAPVSFRTAIGRKSLERDALDAIMMMKGCEKSISPPSFTSSSTIVGTSPVLGDSTPHKRSFQALDVLVNAVGFHREPNDQMKQTKMCPSQLAKRRARRKKLREERKSRLGPWTKKEDRALDNAVKSVNKLPSFSWTQVSKLVPHRDNEQCRNRWRYHVNPELCNDPFTPEEWRFFLEYQRQYGNRWTELGQKMKGRSRTFIGNQWQAAKRTIISALKARRKANMPIVDEDGSVDYQSDFDFCLQSVIERYSKDGSPKKNFSDNEDNSDGDTSTTESLSDTGEREVSLKVKTKRSGAETVIKQGWRKSGSSEYTATSDKTGAQIQESSAWTKVEDSYLAQMAPGVGDNPAKWSDIARRFSRRSGRECRDRWMQHLSDLSVDRMSSTVPFEMRPYTAATRQGMAPKENGFHSQDYKWDGETTSNRWASLKRLVVGQPVSNKRIKLDLPKGNWSAPLPYQLKNAQTSYVPMAPRQHRDNVWLPESKPDCVINNSEVSRTSKQGSTFRAALDTRTVKVLESEPEPRHSEIDSMIYNRRLPKPWTSDEDEVLRESMNVFKDEEHCMQKVAERLPSRCPKQCQQRWVCHLQPGLNKDPLSKEEIRTLLEWQRKLGNKWTLIGQALDNRPKNFIANRWYHRIRPSLFRYITEKHGISHSQIQNKDGSIDYHGDFEGAVEFVVKDLLFGTRIGSHPGKL